MSQVPPPRTGTRAPVNRGPECHLPLGPSWVAAAMRGAEVVPCSTQPGPQDYAGSFKLGTVLPGTASTSGRLPPILAPFLNPPRLCSLERAGHASPLCTW